jgi:GDP-L-fucose synthase
MDHVESVEHINVGPGEDLAIRELAEMIADMVGYRGNILWDTNRPDGMLRKCMDVSKMRALGFTPIMGLREGIQRTIKEYEATKSAGRIP